MSEGRLRNSRISPSMIHPPTMPMDQKAVLHSNDVIRKLTISAIIAGPKPWDACSSPIPRPKRLWNHELAAVRMGTLKQA